MAAVNSFFTSAMKIDAFPISFYCRSSGFEEACLSKRIQPLRFGKAALHDSFIAKTRGRLHFRGPETNTISTFSSCNYWFHSFQVVVYRR